MRICSLLLILVATSTSLLNQPNYDVHQPLATNRTVSLSQTASHLPGFATAFSQGALDYFKNVGLDVLNKVIPTHLKPGSSHQIVQNVHIPDSDGQVGSPIGKLHYWLSNAQLSSTSFSQATVTLTQMGGIRGLSVKIESFKTDATSHWHYRRNSWPHISGTGEAQIHVEASVEVFLQLKAKDEHLQAQVVSTNVHISKLDIHVSGKGSGFYNFILKLIHKSLSNDIASKLQDAVNSNIEGGLNKVLMNFLVIQKILPNVAFDIGMVKDPEFDGNNIVLFESGESYVSDAPKECPEDACPQIVLPTGAVSNRMITMFLSEYVPTSMSFALLQADMMKIKFGPLDVPSNSIIKLNTDYFSTLIPPFANYPGQNLSIVSYVTSTPKVLFAPGGASVTALGDLQVYLMGNSSSDQPKLAFTLKGAVQTSGDAALDGWKLKGKLTYLKSNWTIAQSNIGDFTMDNLGWIFDVFCVDVVMPQVNGKMSEGIILPSTPGIQFVNPQMNWYNHYLTIDTDVIQKLGPERNVHHSFAELMAKRWPKLLHNRMKKSGHKSAFERDVHNLNAEFNCRTTFDTRNL
ncbi:bactericidal permeability-increasing protein-like [Planoprotostelium fungivorum]|uniref:Bactericidal permeability-increasing protein-like n=1 Tax=Planoprotostelium fungivorum TaxID=1890364 RepID=A0A2P6MYD4_9EUKA|nr:bactericidal permeability-increasing protein-like [Planoprotostelium fungivorum]